MKLAYATWKEVEAFDREAVCVIPTGSLEQHGAHLPLFTDSLLSSSVAERAEARRSDHVLLYPCVWLGCSAHHMAMAGTATADATTYIRVITEIVRCASAHGFRKFFLLNGHGGNTEPNGVALRELKREFPNHILAHCGYFSLIPQNVLDETLTGPIKGIRHACEAETSMMMYLFPDLVRTDRLRDDGLRMQPPPPAGLNIIQPFNEITENGSFGYATQASAEKGRQLIEAAVEAVVAAIEHLYNGYVMVGPTP
jgi:creatinine amidohydrolase